MKMIPAILTIDTREQLAYSFSGCQSKHVAFEFRHEALGAGDYSASLEDDDLPEHVCIVERKTHADLLGTLTAGRERFERELERMKPFGFKALVIEARLADVVRGLPRSQANPRSIIASLIAFAQRFGLHVYFGDDRRHSEALTFRILERWVRDRAELSADARQMRVEVTV